MPDDDALDIQIDSDWKAEAQAEKQRLDTEAQNKEGNTAGGPGQMPPADFETLVSTNVSQALLFLGAVPDPRSGQRILSLEMARHHIDMLGVIEEKTKGNLTEKEEELVATSVYELRKRYIQMSNTAATAPNQAEAGGPATGAPGGGIEIAT